MRKLFHYNMHDFPGILGETKKILFLLVACIKLLLTYSRLLEETKPQLNIIRTASLASWRIEKSHVPFE